MARSSGRARIAKSQILPMIGFTFSAMFAVLGFSVGVLPALPNTEVDWLGAMVFTLVMAAGLEGCRRNWSRM